MIELSNASFNHQSMSYKRPSEAGTLSLPLMAGPAASNGQPAVESMAEPSRVVDRWRAAVRDIGLGASTPILREPRALLCDARDARRLLDRGRYDLVVTSPPYPNRMSYIRELRPYMYWLGYLTDGRSAGELDWRAIGGTWGSATSMVAKWEPPSTRPIPYAGMTELLGRIGAESVLLARYVHKYFYDMVDHVESVGELVRQGGTLHYIVGNSKFYDVLLPVEQIFAAIFTAAGLADVEVRTIRKRTSKKELFEFVVSARKPA
jgi:hypothetical protein